jgi:hypothetical protein
MWIKFGTEGLPRNAVAQLFSVVQVGAVEAKVRKGVHEILTVFSKFFRTEDVL